MRLLRRHKYILLALGIYWPAIFAMTHIPVPREVARWAMSDKTMHVMAYLVLVVFVWPAISPYKKVNWKGIKVWGVLAAVAGYGIIDEYLQGRIGRTPDVMDFLADMTGATTGLVILTMMSFWPAMAAVSAIFIFAISNLSNILQVYAQWHFDTVFALTAYGSLTLIWIQHLARATPAGTERPYWCLQAVSVPLGLCCIVTGYALLTGRTVCPVNAATAVFGISTAVLASYATLRFGGEKKQRPSGIKQ